MFHLKKMGEKLFAHPVQAQTLRVDLATRDNWQAARGDQHAQTPASQAPRATNE